MRSASVTIPYPYDTSARLVGGSYIHCMQ